MSQSTNILLSDSGRVLVLLFFALFVGGALRVLYLYRQKNARYQKALGRSRPMFSHVVKVSLGAVLAAVSALIHNLENLGMAFTIFVPLNLAAFGLLWWAMLDMMKESTRKSGWLNPDDEHDEVKDVLERAVVDENLERMRKQEEG